MTVGQRQQRVTVMAELRNDLAKKGSSLTYTALTIMVTRGSQAKGETGLKTWMKGFIAP